MDANNILNENDNYTINNSFNYLLNLFDKESNDDINILNKSNDKENSFIKDYFCCKECYDKFIISKKTLI